MIPGKKGILITLIVVLLFSVALSGCRSTKTTAGDMDVITAEPAMEPAPMPEPTVKPYEPPAQPMMPAEAPPAPMPAPALNVSDLADVFFAYDRSDLTQESRSRLAADAKLLKAYKNVSILIEGHCDERGTNEYNLGLGERRANSAKNYLVSLGVPASRIKTISYGEERPFARGHNEEAWKMNRRAHFVLP